MATYIGVQFFELNQQGQDVYLGSLYFHDGAIHVLPASDDGKKMLEHILKTEQVAGPASKWQRVSATDDPAAFLDNLRYEYKSAYFRATKPGNLTVHEPPPSQT